MKHAQTAAAACEDGKLCCQGKEMISMIIINHPQSPSLLKIFCQKHQNYYEQLTFTLSQKSGVQLTQSMLLAVLLVENIVISNLLKPVC